MRGALAVRLALTMTAVLIVGCGGDSSSPTEPARRDSLVLLSVDPAEGTPARLGGEIQVVARFRYTFAQAARGKISVLAHPLPFGLPLITNPFPAQFDVEGQEGETTIRVGIPLEDPDEPLRPGFIAARFSLFPEGQRETMTIVTIRYEVVP